MRIIMLILFLVICIVFINYYLAETCQYTGGATIIMDGKVGCVYYDK